jgi:hypothetical protein
MARYASGKKSKAISDISGFKVNYKSLKTTYDNLRVEPEEFDPKHPQLTPAKNVFDATALFQPRPDNAEENVKLNLGFTQDIFASKIEKSQKGIGVKASGSVALLSGFNFNFSADSGVAVGTGALGTVSVETEQLINEESVSGTGAVGVVNAISNAITVTVSSVDGANKYFVGGVQQPTLELAEGNTYVFTYPSAHPFRLSTTSNGTHDGGSEYTSGVTHDSSTQTTFVVPTGAPQLYYYCSQHSAMGGTANTPSASVPVALLTATETGLAGTGAIGAATLVGNPVEDGVAGTGAIGSETIKISGWGNEAWGDNTWGDG